MGGALIALRERQKVNPYFLPGNMQKRPGEARPFLRGASGEPRFASSSFLSFTALPGMKVWIVGQK
jgi:hypothetical protein